ncbi:MAG: transaldolase [Campylobacterota bacterium]|nr:transaldolase [Campylobacterota bacterium]
MRLKQEINYSLWCDFVERDFLENEFQEIINNETVQGATSNPAIFEQSISNSPAYAQQKLMLQANHPKKIYEQLAITDIKRAAQIMHPLYEKDKNDGFISIEVDPSLCDDMMGTIEEGARLNAQINEENVMIKVPATEAGYGAMRELTSMGIHVNATLIFSPQQAIECAKALDEGIAHSGRDIKAVISVFVSRFDRLCDKELSTKKLQTSKLGIMNAALCYHEIQKFDNANIRTLFASTGVKGDTLKPSYYIDELIYPNSVNTAPLATIKAWVQNGVKEPTKLPTLQECQDYFAALKHAQVDMPKIYATLLKDGLDAFKVSFIQLLEKVLK